MTTETVDDSRIFQQELLNLFNNEDMSDIQLVVGGKRFNTHKLVLILHSDVFKTMLTSGIWPESQCQRVVLQEEPECVAVFEDFLKYLYGGKIVLESCSVLPVLSLADKYNIKHLSKSCINFMCNNCILCNSQFLPSWLQYAILRDLKTLETICRKFITCNFEVVCNKMELNYLTMNASLLASFLKSSDLVVQSEIALHFIVVLWLSTCPKSVFRECFIKLMVHIRFPMMELPDIPRLEKICFKLGFKDFYMKRIFSSIKYHTLPSKEERLKFIKEFTNRKLCYPRNYTSGAWFTTMYVEKFSQLERGEVRGAFFTTPVSLSEKDQHEFIDWHLHLYPKGVKFDDCMMIGVPCNINVPGQFLKNVRLSISSVFSKRVHVEICVLIQARIDDGYGGVDDYICDQISRHAIFDQNCPLYNIDYLVPYEALMCQNSMYRRCKDEFEITIIIKPEYDLHF